MLNKHSFEPFCVFWITLWEVDSVFFQVQATDKNAAGVTDLSNNTLGSFTELIIVSL